MLINDEIMNPCGTESPSERGNLSVCFILRAWQQWTRSHCHCFFPKTLIFYYIIFLWGFAAPGKKKTFWKHLTYHLSLKLGHLLQSHCSPLPVKVGGWLGKTWCPAVAGTWAGPRQWPQRLGHPAGARAEGGAPPPLPPHLLTGHQQSHKKKLENFLFNIPWTRDPVPARGGAQGKGAAETLNVGLPPTAYLRPLLSAVFRVTSDTENVQYNSFWI